MMFLFLVTCVVSRHLGSARMYIHPGDPAIRPVPTGIEPVMGLNDDSWVGFSR